MNDNNKQPRTVFLAPCYPNYNGEITVDTHYHGERYTHTRVFNTYEDAANYVKEVCNFYELDDYIVMLSVG